MPYRPYRRIVGPVRWNDPVTTLRYIGPYYAEILENFEVITLRDVVVYFSFRALEAIVEPSPEDYMFEKFAELTRNRNAQTCQEGYLPRPINRMAFNALVDLVDYAIQHPAEFNDPEVLLRFDDLDLNLAGVLACRMNEGHEPSDDPQFLCNKVPLMGNVGDEPEIRSMRRCPCIDNAEACNGDCTWTDNACISRYADLNRHNYAPDVPPYRGDWTTDVNAPTRPGTRYVMAGHGRAGRMFAFGQNAAAAAAPYNGYDGGADVDEELLLQTPPLSPRSRLPSPSWQASPAGYPPPGPFSPGWVSQASSRASSQASSQQPSPAGYPPPGPFSPGSQSSAWSASPPPLSPPLQPMMAARGRRPSRGREVTPQPNARPLPPRRPRRSLRLKEKEKRKSKK